jgi:hypothetical protein
VRSLAAATEELDPLVDEAREQAAAYAAAVVGRRGVVLDRVRHEIENGFRFRCALYPATSSAGKGGRQGI